MSIVIGDIPKVVISYFQLRRYTVFSVLPGCARLSGIAFIALFALLSVFTGIALISGGFNAEGCPCMSIVIGDIPKVVITYFQLRRYTVFPVLPGCAFISLISLISLISRVALVAFFALQLRQGNQIIPDGIIAVLPLYESVIYPQFNLFSVCAVISRQLGK